MRTGSHSCRHVSGLECVTTSRTETTEAENAVMDFGIPAGSSDTERDPLHLSEHRGALGIGEKAERSSEGAAA